MFLSSLCKSSKLARYSTVATVSAPNSVPRGRLFFITLRKSKNHQTERIKQSCKALQLSKIHQVQVHRDTPTIRGLIYHTRHLLSVKSVSTATLFPAGTESFAPTFTSKKARRAKTLIERRKAQLARLKVLAKQLDDQSVLSIPKQRKRPSRTHL